MPQSRGAANLLYRYPILMDAVTKEMERRGDASFPMICGELLL